MPPKVYFIWNGRWNKAYVHAGHVTQKVKYMDDSAEVVVLDTEAMTTKRYTRDAWLKRDR